ncbi:phenylalanine--tRNA ligase subunit beta [Polymorphobacter sp. PAMC 29334]|uniref:phenylalanine--tRNA ligase subunit beta n=1 Tax=Polymorphobacter sp. PAMC 29334 TaxID=2862331 RepID=UPI001C7765A6|nr:phenylalanine--tRNA ligase subunit beta [Polymorphobacter sp. PAMC 29334]QYE36126.1 phenylalanine--tRNA ligase subunit beta [Polymorphobacter sp. PAMC 29334]
MKFTLSWLRDHLDTDASLDRILTALTDCGLEVEGVTDPAKALAPFVIAEVLTAAPHPQADKLQVLTVTTGSGDPLQVVCGATNARAGMKGVFGAVGTYVPGSDLTLKVASIRGVESRGMMCSMRELELSDEHDGIIDLPADAPVGTAYAAWAALDDPVIEVGITPNRQDCMGVAGIARDLAAAGIGTLRTPPVAPVAGCFPCPIEIRTDDDGCPAFLGRAVRGVSNRPSPEWLQRRLRAIGQKPISALVDITNFITFDRGRPLHVYDLAHVAGGLTARRAVPGESVVALNGKTYALDATMTVIADDAQVHDIGGIMGGAASGVSAATTDVLIECAYFTPERIGATGRKLGLSSDARARFERGVDPGFLAGGLDLATAMVLDLCGGEASDAVVAGSIPVPDKTVMYRPERTRTLTGVAVAADEQAAILTRLGFSVTRGERWRIAVPSWRRDIDGEADIVEEVVRINGFAHIPSTPLPRAEGVARPTATPAQLMERRLRRALAARGLDEAVTWSFVSPAQAEPFGGAAWTLDNPISSELSAMRPSLIPGLLAAAKRNLDRGEAGVRLFEVGRRYLAEGEHATAAILMAGAARARDWQTGAATSYSAFDAKAEAVAALAAAGVPVDRLSVLPPADPWFHPGRSGRLALGAKMVLASFGELHPRVGATRDPVAVAEIYLDAIPQARSAKRTRPVFTPPPLQAVTRDFAFVVAADLPAETLLRAVRMADKVAITNVALFDRFPLDDKVSLAVTVTLQPVERSFTDADIDAISAKIVAAAAKAGGVLRG